MINNQNKYRVFYTNGKTPIYNCSPAVMEQQFRDNDDIEFYQEEIKSNVKYA